MSIFHLVTCSYHNTITIIPHEERNIQHTFNIQLPFFFFSVKNSLDKFFPTQNRPKFDLLQLLLEETPDNWCVRNKHRYAIFYASIVFSYSSPTIEAYCGEKRMKIGYATFIWIFWNFWIFLLQKIIKKVAFLMTSIYNNTNEPYNIHRISASNTYSSIILPIYQYLLKRVQVLSNFLLSKQRFNNQLSCL
jgi:hypothetical protein